MKVVYRNPDKVTNEIWREYFCQCCRKMNTWGNIELTRELTDQAGGENYICKFCVADGSAKIFIKSLKL